jgi:predicted protein tyrosine phosphatase
MGKSASALQWITQGTGRLSLRSRPGSSFFRTAHEAGVTRLVTLLSVREGGESVGKQAQGHGLAWTWLPLENADYPTGTAHAHLRDHLAVLSGQLEAGESLVIHCAAGIHRTGMVAYGLLRYRGYASDAALALVGQMRAETLAGMVAKRQAWGDEVVRELGLE